MRRKNNSEIGFTVSEAPLMDNGHKEQEGHFIMPNNASWRKCNEDFDEIQDTAKTYSESIGKVQNLLNKEPNFLEGYAQIGASYLDCDSVDQAIKTTGSGLHS